jgi:hypothetical protein
VLLPPRRRRRCRWSQRGRRGRQPPGPGRRQAPRRRTRTAIGPAGPAGCLPARTALRPAPKRSALPGAGAVPLAREPPRATASTPGSPASLLAMCSANSSSPTGGRIGPARDGSTRIRIPDYLPRRMLKDMNRERAETYLRRLAEVELRHVAEPASLPARHWSAGAWSHGPRECTRAPLSWWIRLTWSVVAAIVALFHRISHIHRDKFRIAEFCSVNVMGAGGKARKALDCAGTTPRARPSGTAEDRFPLRWSAFGLGGRFRS